MVELVVQMVDFLFKAVMAYAKTPEGQKEFNDIWEAAHAAGVDVNGAWSEMTGDHSTTTSQDSQQASGIYSAPSDRVVRSAKGE